MDKHSKIFIIRKPDTSSKDYETIRKIVKNRAIQIKTHSFMFTHNVHNHATVFAILCMFELSKGTLQSHCHHLSVA